LLIKNLILKDVLEYYYKKDISKINYTIKAYFTKTIGSHHQKTKAIELNFAPLFDADTIINTLEGYHKDSPI